MGLLEIWMHFLNYAQRIYSEGVPNYKTLEWRPMKKINEATKPRTTIHLCSKAEDRPGCPALGFFHCVLFHISFCFPGIQPPHSFYFVWGRGKGWFWHPLRF